MTYTGNETVLELVEKAEQHAQSRLGKCQMEYFDLMTCESAATSWCTDCNSLTCPTHTIACCSIVRCEPCHQIHQVHHEWLKRQPEFKK